MSAKNNLRKRILTQLRDQSQEDRQQKSRLIQEKLFDSGFFQKADTILFYASLDEEVWTLNMISEALILRKRVALPKVIEDTREMKPLLIDSVTSSLDKGKYGILEPKNTGCNDLDLSEIDLVIVPGVAFDSKGNRLGRGAGYYDRFLARLSPDVPRIALAYDIQIVDSLPELEAHDLPVKILITNK